MLDTQFNVGGFAEPGGWLYGDADMQEQSFW